MAVLARFFAQRSQSLPAMEARRFAAQLAGLVKERGLPRPLKEDECGAPGSMSDQECAPLVARVMNGLSDPLLAEAAKQLVKTCFYPEFKICRDSFREVTRDGTCRRQELERVRTRISGTHCVDCPHWVEYSPADHVVFLRREWHGDPAVLAAHRELFLPEDFRALRRWLHATARRDANLA
jgi:hypothetical protein